MTTPLRSMLLAIGVSATLVRLAAQAPLPPPAASRERTLVLNDQQTLAPGYPIGDVAIAQPKIADFKVLRGRRELLITGKGAGSTRLTVWDQQHVKRDELVIHVTTRQAGQLERDLGVLLEGFPTVRVLTLDGGLVVGGSVSSRDDLATVSQIASTAKVANVVRYVPPVFNPPVLPTPAESHVIAPPPPPVTPTPAPVMRVQYELNLFEASAAFKTGSYRTGVEPAGRRLSQCTVSVPVDQQQSLFIGENARNPRTSQPKTKDAALECGAASGELPSDGQVGIRVTLKPGTPDAQGAFQTMVLIETNLPFESKTYDPHTWRRANWRFNTASGEPFGVAGNDLLAAAAVQPGGGSALGSVFRTGGTLARTASVPGVEYLGPLNSVFGSRSYRQKSTQLVLVLRPRMVTP